MMLPGQNPFRSRHVQPGQIAYRFVASGDVAELARRFLTMDRGAQIVGHHGSGKSTLLAHLITELSDHFDRVVRVTLTASTRGSELEPFATPGGRTLLSIDGFEQLRPWTRYAIVRECRRLDTRLLVTTHAPCWLPTLWRTQMTVDLAQLLIQDIMRMHAPDDVRNPPSDGVDLDVPTELISRLYREHVGNMREILFSLYDWYQLRIDTRCPTR